MSDDAWTTSHSTPHSFYQGANLDEDDPNAAKRQEVFLGDVEKKLHAKAKWIEEELWEVCGS